MRWPYLHLPLDGDLTDEAGNGFTVSIDGTADWSTKAGWLTLDGSTNLRIAYSAALRSLFTIGDSAGLFLIDVDAATIAATSGLISAPGGQGTSGNQGARLAITNTGRMRTFANDSSSINDSTEDVIDGNENKLGYFLSPHDNDYNQFICSSTVTAAKGPYADGGRGSYPSITSMGYSLVSALNPDVVVGARQRDDGTLDQYFTGAIRNFTFVNFDRDIPDNRKLCRMMRQYFTTGEFGSEWQ